MNNENVTKFAAILLSVELDDWLLVAEDRRNSRTYSIPSSD